MISVCLFLKIALHSALHSVRLRIDLSVMSGAVFQNKMFNEIMNIRNMKTRIVSPTINKLNDPQPQITKNQ
jgi:hypothetical protein